MTAERVILPYAGLAVVRRSAGDFIDLSVEHVIAVRVPVDQSDTLRHAIYTIEHGWTAAFGPHTILTAAAADVERIVLRMAAELGGMRKLGHVEGCEPWVLGEAFDEDWWDYQ